MLKVTGDDGREALDGIRAISAEIGRHVVTGSYRTAARRFVDYWSGAGTFESLKPEVQANVVHYIPKAWLNATVSRIPSL